MGLRAQPCSLSAHRKFVSRGVGLDLHLPGGLCAAGGLPGYTARGSDCPAPEPAGGGGSLCVRQPGLPAHRGPDRLLARPASGPAAPRAAGARSCLAAGHQWRGYTFSSPHLPAHLLLPAHLARAAVLHDILAHGLPADAPLRLVFCSTCCCWASGTSCCSAPSSISTSILTRWWGPQWVPLPIVPHLWQLVSSALVSGSPGHGLFLAPTPATSITERNKVLRPSSGSVHHWVGRTCKGWVG